MSRDYDLVSVDVWDTILRRSVHPDEVKVHTARWLQLHHASALRPEYARDLRASFVARCAAEAAIAAEAKASGHDDEYTLEEVYRRWLATVSDRSPPAALLAELEAAELAFERRSITLDPGILATLERYRGTPLVLASDFYMSGPTVETLVRHVGFSLPLRAVYVSCDHRLSKRSGRLFEKIQRDLGVTAGRHLHIGDNPVSDVEVPRRLGISAMLYHHPSAEAARARSAGRFALREQRTAVARLDRQARERVHVPARLHGVARECFALGVRHGLPFFAFSYGVLEDLVRKKYDRVHYFTREGVFFQQLHEAIAKESPFPGPVPTSDVLCVSRVSTFCASLKEPTTTELMRVWNLYSTQSMGALLTTLGLERRDFDAAFTRHGIDPTREIQYPWQDESVQRLFADVDFQERLREAIARRRKPLLAYLADNGLTPKTRRAAIVDIGWRGTIQDNVAELLPDTTIEGYYFALYRILNPQRPTVTKHGLFSDENLGQASHVAFEWPSVVEMLCNSATGSAVGYEISDETGRPRALTESHADEDRVWHDYTRHFQAGVLAYTARLSPLLRLHHVEASELLDVGRRKLASLVSDPPRALTEAYFSLKHNEGFGLGAFVEKRASFPLSVRALERSGWPQGLLKYYRLAPLVKLYNARVLGLDDEGRIHRT